MSKKDKRPERTYLTSCSIDVYDKSRKISY